MYICLCIYMYIYTYIYIYNCVMSSSSFSNSFWTQRSVDLMVAEGPLQERVCRAARASARACATQCPRSARSVPARCPHSARTVPATVPAQCPLVKIVCLCKRDNKRVF